MTIRSSSSDVISPALNRSYQYIERLAWDPSSTKFRDAITHRLFRSTSAFLHTKFEYRRPTPFILVRAYIIFCFPSTLVLRRRRMNWKFDFSPDTSATRSLVSMRRKERFWEILFKGDDDLHMMGEMLFG